LAPDGSSARRIKKILAEKTPGLYRLVGTWSELMAQVEVAYQLPPSSGDWVENLEQAASRQNSAFWSSSFKVAPRETIAELDAAIYRLLRSKGPNADLQDLLDGIDGDARLNRRLSDLSQLMKTVGKLPSPLQKMANFLESQDSPIRTFRVYYLDDSIDLDAWQVEVLKRLEKDAPPLDLELQSILKDSMFTPETPSHTLKAVRNLYSRGAKPPRKIDGVRVIAVRDSLAEAEIAAGLIQKKLESGSRVSGIGLLLPDDPLSLMAVENVFKRCGLPLSGFHRPIGQRDLGREMMREFLLCLRKPAPIMAIAALLTSPLMPWPGEEGHSMAQAVMEGDVMLRSAEISSPARKVMDLLDENVTTPTEFERQLKRFVAQLSADESLYDHLQQARETAKQLQEALSGMSELDWEQLLYLANPEHPKISKPTDYWQEGVPVFHEGTLPWCTVRHLFVMGFNEGHYPAGAGSSAVFIEAEWEQIVNAGWPVTTSELIRKRQRTLFAEQLAAATDDLTLFFARRNAGGHVLEPSSSLVFIARSLGIDPDDLIIEINRSEDVQRIPDLPIAKTDIPSSPRELAATDIELKVDLLEAFGPKNGELKPLSPSAAESLMVSPFAWLLGRLDCMPKEWITDEFDVMTAGILAHSVFEELFQAGQPLPAEDEISVKVPKILNEQMLKIAPYLRSPDWRVERFKFESEILKAAVHWKQLLASCSAELMATEQWLRGQYGDVPLHGQSDLLVQLPSEKLLVVDYKKSSSGKRRDRMRSGFDLQAHLYRLMIQTAGLPGFEATPEDIGIVYYLLNDTTALVDSPVDSDDTVPGLEILAADTSSQAMQHLDRRLIQIRRGTVRLNTTEDEEWWSKNASLPIYALDDSPLLRLFMRTGVAPS
jgi:hypothetical protein